MMTGSTARGGGLWKYTLQADVANGLLRRNIPVMTQVLQFLDFHSLNVKGLQGWRTSGLRRKYNTEVEPSINYTAPIFLDSGGFKLLWNSSVDLSNFGLSISNGNGAQTILDLQRDLGGDIVATLDFPLPPGLGQLEAQDRMRRSLDNAVIAARLIQHDANYNPFLYVAAHGQDRGSMAEYVRQVFSRFTTDELRNVPFGLAVGSIVPLRGAKRYDVIVDLLRGLHGSVPEERSTQIPIHVFGVTGNLIPLLAYLGVDSFDSSTYIQEARSLKYIQPSTHRSRPILEMKQSDWICECRVCANVTLAEMQRALVSEVKNRINPETGHFKSKYYGDIALHNLEQDFRLLDETRQAIEACSLQEYLIEHALRFPALAEALRCIALDDTSLAQRLTRTVFPNLASVSVPAANPTRYTDLPEIGKLQPLSAEQLALFDAPQAPDGVPTITHARTVSLNYTPQSFDVLSNGYQPPRTRDILLIIPCSDGKPYSTSRTHQFITDRLGKSLGADIERVHIVTLSGLYGPVPHEFESEEAIVGYDFHLEASNELQISLVTDRLVAYLERHAERYTACLGYATTLAYRTVIERAARRASQITVLPSKLKSRRLTEFFRGANVAQLIAHAQKAVKTVTPDVPNVTALAPSN